jgi:signal transduction histidine kinase
MPKGSKPGEQSLVLARLGAKGLWGRELAVIAFILNAILTLLMDVLRLDDATWLWFVPSLGSYSVALALGFVASQISRRFEGSRIAWIFNLAMAGLFGGVKNVVVGLLADNLGLTNDATYQFRFIGGVVMGTSLLFIVALSTGARIEHRQAVNLLEETQKQLLTHRNRLQEVVEVENSALVTASKETLIPKLRNIENLLSGTETLRPVIDELRNTIENSLRPLTKSVESSPLKEIPFLLKAETLKLTRVKFPLLASTSQLLQPGRTFIFNYVTIGIYMYFFFGYIGLGYAAVSVAIEALLHWTIKRLLPVRLIPRRKALTQLSVISVLGSIPSLAVVYLNLANDQQYLAAIIVCLTISSIGGVLGGYTRILDGERDRVEQEISQGNDSLAHEIALYEQKIWVFRKSWQLLLHGKVQAALTAALTRLSLPHDDDSVKLELARQDLRRAEAALQSQPLSDIDLESSISELSSTWSGVCDVKVSVSERANRALRRNRETMFGFNEIMREAVSNAVRHGAATHITMEIDRIDDEVLDFVASNDGTLVSTADGGGLGSQMMNELTTEWSIATDPVTKLTELRARIPVSL